MVDLRCTYMYVGKLHLDQTRVLTVKVHPVYSMGIEYNSVMRARETVISVTHFKRTRFLVSGVDLRKQTCIIMYQVFA